jgi:IQ and AAA domain-containing protein
MRHVLDGVIGRLIEVKHEMIKLELSEYHFFDDVLQDLKLTPVRREIERLILNYEKLNIYLFLKNDIEIPIPKYFTLERMEAIKEKEKLLADVLSTMAPKEAPKVKIIITRSAFKIFKKYSKLRIKMK